jgi:ATP-binding cassette subfamily B protein/subfamily B ATP-binding cassette protein MsbA
MTTLHPRLRAIVRRPVQFVARRLDMNQKRSVAVIRDVALNHWRIIVFVFFFNLLASFFEGSTFGILTVALSVLTMGDTADMATSLGSLGTFAETLRADMGSERLFVVLVVLAVVSQILRSVLQFIGSLVGVYMTSSLLADVKGRAFEQCMTMSYAQINTYKLGDMVSYVGQSGSIVSFIKWINAFLRQLLRIAAYVGVLLWLSWGVTLLVIPLLFGISLALRIIVKRISVIARQLMLLGISFNEKMIEYIQAIRVVRTFGRQYEVIDEVKENLRDQAVYTRRAEIWGSLTEPLMEMSTVLVVASLLIGGYVVLGSEAARAVFAQATVFLLMLYRLMPAVGSVNQSIVKFSKFLPKLERGTAFLRTDDKEYTRDGSRAFAGLQEQIAFQDVSFCYQPDAPWAVRNINLAIPKGAMVALVGASGAGKSTMADLLLRMYDPTEGKITVDGVNLRKLKLTDWRQHLGVVSQDTFIFHASVRDNIAFGKPDATDEEVIAAAQAANAHEFILHMSDGYDTILGDRGYRLSGGQRQRIAIARAILHNPQILLLDEATSALDSKSEQLIQQALGNLRGSRTVVAIAHRLSTIAMADQIVVLEQGEVVEQGTHAELLARQGHYADFWAMQAEVGHSEDDRSYS